MVSSARDCFLSAWLLTCFYLIQQLMSIIKTLQAKVAEEAMKKAMMELTIREEVAQEMAEQITEIENMYRFVCFSYFNKL